MTGLEAVKKLRQNWIDETHLFDDDLLDIVENALKEYEMEHTLRIRLENINYELVREKERNEKKLKALEIIKETPIFAWYVTIYKDAYEMVSDVKGFRVNNSVEELQEMFDLLREVLK